MMSESGVHCFNTNLPKYVALSFRNSFYAAVTLKCYHYHHVKFDIYVYGD